MVELKTRFETLLTRNDVNGVRFIHLSYLTNLMAYLCSQRTPNVQIMFLMFDWSIHRLLVLNTSWKPDSPQIIIFANICFTLGMFEIKTRFEMWIKWNVNGVSLSPSLPYNTYGLPVLTKDTKCPIQVFYFWIDDLQTISAKYGLETWFPSNDDIRKYFLVM
jgi:hypothetical protein